MLGHSGSLRQVCRGSWHAETTNACARGALGRLNCNNYLAYFLNCFSRLICDFSVYFVAFKNFETNFELFSKV